MTEETQGAPEGVAEELLPENQAVEAGEAGEPTGDDAAAAAEPEPKPRKTAQDRIDELTRARREAEREAEYWRSKAQAPAPAQAEPQGDDEPDPATYDYGEADVRYVRDLARYEARQEFRKQAEEQAAARQAGEIDQAFGERQQAAMEKYDDYESVVYRTQWACTPVMADAIKTSEEGADVAYHLAKNPTEARRIAALSPIAQVRELTKLEAKLSAAPPPPKTATDAPEPPPQARGAGGKFKVSGDTTDFAAFEKQYGGS